MVVSPSNPRLWRPTATPAFVALILLGLLLGLGDLGRVMRGPVERLDALQKSPPTPRRALWAAAYRGPARRLADADGPLIALSVVALLGVGLALGAGLGPGFRLVKPDHDTGGPPRLGAHLEVGRLVRVAAAALVSLWLSGALYPVSLVLGAAHRAPRFGMLLGGLPAWCGTAGSAGLLALALVLVPVLWWLWGPRGPVFPASGVTLPEVVSTSFLAAAAAMPAFAILYGARGWVAAAGEALTAVDSSGWHTVFWLAAGLPVAACVWLAAVVAAYRPGPLSSQRTIGLALGGLVGVGTVVGVDPPIRSTLARWGIGASSLAGELRLPASPLARHALLLGPDNALIGSITEDGSSAGDNDRITSAGPAREAVQTYLEQRSYRSTLALRAYEYLNSCRALDWESTKSLELSLATLRRAPAPVVAQNLIEKLGECAITPENRRVLDAVANDAEFAWPPREGRRRLGAAYVRFGDTARAREYLLKAGLTSEEARQLLGGASPLINGRVAGKLTIQGKPLAGVRVGLLGARNLRWMVGPCPPMRWSLVMAAAHTDAGGRFRFQAVPEGRYLLVVTGGGIGRDGRPVVDHSPGAFTVDRYQPAVDLPSIDLRFERPGRVPATGDLGNTVRAGWASPAA